MRILGIETSCDETAAAIVENGPSTSSGLTVLSSVVSSSLEIHKKYGGIVPEQAAREQIRSIIPVIEEALDNLKCKNQNAKLSPFGRSAEDKQFKMQNYIDAIAITVGPGLIGSLLIGIETAKTLSFAWNKPIVPVNHLIAHIYANFISSKPEFPAICLVVSGGHTELVLMKNHRNLKWLGGTRDDAAGECFDKCARILGLGYPGGPVIEKAANQLASSSIIHHPSSIKLPRPMINEDNFDFSFSGLKTAVLYIVQKRKQFNNLTVRQFSNFLSFEIQEAITDVLVKKTLMAVKKYKVKSILIGGGVAANSRLREKFQSTINHQPLIINLFIPDKKLCTDNAAIVASTAFFNYKPCHWSKIKPDSSLEIE